MSTRSPGRIKRRRDGNESGNVDDVAPCAIGNVVEFDSSITLTPKFWVDVEARERAETLPVATRFPWPVSHLGESLPLSGPANVETYGGHAMLAGDAVTGLAGAVNVLAFAVTPATHDVGRALRAAHQVLAESFDFDGWMKFFGSLDCFGDLCGLERKHFACPFFMCLLPDKDYYRHIHVVVKRKVLIQIEIFLS
jgi:hypothetical protein